jgi:hypothetical protein
MYARCGVKMKMLFERIYGIEITRILETEKARLGGIIPQTYENGVPNLLHNEIMSWLQENNDLPFEDRREKVRITLLERTSLAEALHYATMCFMTMDGFFDNTNKFGDAMLIALKGGKEIAEHLEKEHISQRNKDAKKVKDENFQKVWGDLKEYWQNNLTRIKTATQTAIELEKTDIFKNAHPQPKRAVIERKVREWKKQNTNN